MIFILYIYRKTLKKIQKNRISSDDYKVLKHEVKILTDMYHPAITQYFASFKEDGYLFVVMEYCNVTFSIYIFKYEFFCLYFN